MIKLIQLISVDTYIFALADNGSFWEFDLDVRQWLQCPLVSMPSRPKVDSVSELAISERTKKILYRHEIHTIEQLLDVGLVGLKKIPRLGNKSIYELESALDDLRLNLV